MGQKTWQKSIQLTVTLPLKAMVPEADVCLVFGAKFTSLVLGRVMSPLTPSNSHFSMLFLDQNPSFLEVFLIKPSSFCWVSTVEGRFERSKILLTSDYTDWFMTGRIPNMQQITRVNWSLLILRGCIIQTPILFSAHEGYQWIEEPNKVVRPPQKSTLRRKESDLIDMTSLATSCWGTKISEMLWANCQLENVFVLFFSGNFRRWSDFSSIGFPDDMPVVFRGIGGVFFLAPKSPQNKSKSSSNRQKYHLGTPIEGDNLAKLSYLLGRGRVRSL